MQAEDIEFATEWSERALQLMADNGVPPAPDNYSIWFRYASGRLPELNQEIDGRIASALPIDIDTTISLQKKYFAEDKLTDVTLNTGTRLNTRSTRSSRSSKSRSATQRPSGPPFAKPAKD